MKKVIKSLFAVVLICALIFGIFLLLLLGNYSQVRTDIAKYEKDLLTIGNAAKLMPELDTLGDYTDIEYTYKLKCYSIFMGFFSDAFALFVTYDQDQYNTEKEKILSEYIFLDAPVMRSADTYELPVTELEYKGYSFKIVPDEEYIDYCACKSFMMIGFNDETSEIVYMYYYDFDIDYIGEVGDNPEEEMRELIDTAFAWVD